jgi:hypothetical protein
MKKKKNSDKICSGNPNTHFTLNFFFFENFAVYRINVEKYCGAGQDKDDSIAHAHLVLDT